MMFHVGWFHEGSGVEKMRITNGIGMFTTSVDSNVKLDVAGAALLNQMEVVELCI